MVLASVSAVIGGCASCDNQRLTLSRMFPAAGPSVTNEMSATASFSPCTRKLACRICESGCGSQFWRRLTLAVAAGRRSTVDFAGRVRWKPTPSVSRRGFAGWLGHTINFDLLVMAFTTGEQKEKKKRYANP